VTISSPVAPDLHAVCRSIFGRDFVAADRIGTGQNSRVFRVTLAGAPGEPTPAPVVIKFYRRDAGDPRDRLGTEFGSLQFLWQNGARAIPRPIAIDVDRHCAVYEYIAGDVASAAPTTESIDACVEFLTVLKRLCCAAGSGQLPVASEACFSIAAVAASVEGRAARLRRDACDSEERERLYAWLDNTFDPTMCEVRQWCHETASAARIAFGADLPRTARTLSSSDFGLHNAIRRPDGTIAFLDFEYFGWDDPAKTIVDYLLHPGMTLGGALRRRFADRFQAAFADIPLLADRARIVYPLFGLKWSLIVLNDFLPGRFSDASSELRRAQLAKADALVVRVRGDYANNPYLS
jgi:hypothetical protein